MYKMQPETNEPCCYITCDRLADYEIPSDNPKHPYESTYTCEEHKEAMKALWIVWGAD
jgi:hypothetical protein